MKIIYKCISKVLLFLILFYRYVISPHTMRSCRYEPSCSVYSYEAIKTHGPFRGLALAIKRIISCNPKGGVGFDPVPTVEEIKKNKKKHT